MFGGHFYHERIKRTVGAFGSLFNNMYIIRKNSSGASTSQVRVPLAFAPKRKFIEEIKQRENDPQTDEYKIAITLPRMSFEIVGMNYDPSRQLPKTNACVVAGSTPSTRGKIFTKTPYNIQFQLNVYAKNHDDVLQVVEQIFPYFTPQYTLSMKPLDEYPQIIDDIPLILNGVSFSDDYEGPIEQRRTIIYTLDFEMKMDFYGPQTESKIIETANIEFFIDDSSIQTNTITTNPSPVSPDSDYTFVETITLTRDSS